jgi:hypothetical protein
VGGEEGGGVFQFLGPWSGPQGYVKSRGGLIVLPVRMFVGDTSLQGLIGNMDEQQLLQILGGSQGVAGLSSLAGLTSRGSSAGGTSISRPSESEPPTTASSQ